MSFGMSRKLDDLGRLVIPIETRRMLSIRRGDKLGIEVNGNTIVLTKMTHSVTVGPFELDVDRQALSNWVDQLVDEVGSDDPEAIAEEIRRRLGL